MTITIPAGVHICPLCNAEPACGLDEYGDPVACERCDAFVPSRPHKPPMRGSVRFGMAFLLGVALGLLGFLLALLAVAVSKAIDSAYENCLTSGKYRRILP